jgi:D-alanine-D-alanine ligase-like ATP-grasp enzyme
LLQVMGAPLVGSPVQASVVTGGRITFRGLRPRLQSKRIQMICECLR